MPEEARRKIGAYWKGRKRSLEHGQRTAAAKRGIPRPAYVVEKIREAKRGKKLSPEHKKKLSLIGKGRKASADTRAKIAASKIGNKNGCGRRSPQAIAAIRSGIKKARATRRAEINSDSGQLSLF